MMMTRRRIVVVVDVPAQHAHQFALVNALRKYIVHERGLSIASCTVDRGEWTTVVALEVSHQAARVPVMPVVPDA